MEFITQNLGIIAGVVALALIGLLGWLMRSVVPVLVGLGWLVLAEGLGQVLRSVLGPIVFGPPLALVYVIVVTLPFVLSSDGCAAL